MDVSMYEARADSINVNDIAENSNNRIVLRRIKRNNVNDVESYYKSLYVQNEHDDDGEDYCPEGADDMGWLGYFIGKNNHVQDLFFLNIDVDIDIIKPFIMRVNSNNSISVLHFRRTNLYG